MYHNLCLKSLTWDVFWTGSNAEVATFLLDSLSLFLLLRTSKEDNYTEITCLVAHTCRLLQIRSTTLFLPLPSRFLKASPFRTCRTDRASSCMNSGKTASPGWGRRRFSLWWDLWVQIMQHASLISPLSSQLPAVAHQQDLPALCHRIPGGARDGVHHAPPRSEPEPLIQFKTTGSYVCMQRGVFARYIFNV